MDSGVDLDHPALQTTSTGERKITDWVTATDPVTEGDATWRLMLNTVQGATAAYPGTSTVYTLPNATTAYKINRFSESITAASEPGGDVNRDGDTSDRFGVLYNPVNHDIWVDSNQNLVFEAGEKMAPYGVDHQVGHFGTCDVDAAGTKHCMPFVVEYREDVSLAPYGDPSLPATADFVNIGITEDAHASHVAGIAAGHSLFGGTMDGQAPGAKIVSSRACTWGGGCTAAALTDGMIDLALNRGRRRHQHVDRWPPGPQRRQQRACPTSTTRSSTSARRAARHLGGQQRRGHQHDRRPVRRHRTSCRSPPRSPRPPGCPTTAPSRELAAQPAQLLLARPA